MPRFYFDMHDGQSEHIDHTGTILRNQDEAKDQATRALTEMAADYVPGDGPQRNLEIRVRGENSEPLLELTLKFQVRSTT